MTGACEAFLPTLWERAKTWNRCSHGGPRRGWPRGWNFHYQGLAENHQSHISSGTCNCLLISNNLKHVIATRGHRNESCHRLEICFLPWSPQSVLLQFPIWDVDILNTKNNNNNHKVSIKVEKWGPRMPRNSEVSVPPAALIQPSLQ